MALGTWFLSRKKNPVLDKANSINQIGFVVSGSILSNEQVANDDFFLTKDKSLMYSKASGDYSILLGGNWRFELIIDSSTGLCIKIQCFLDELRVTFATLALPKFQHRHLYVTSAKPLSPLGGCHYYPFKDMAFWDPQKHLLCIGSPQGYGEAVEFTNNTIAVIDNGKLMCVYLVLDDIVDDTIFKDYEFPPKNWLEEYKDDAN